MIAVPANTITLGVSNPPLGLTTATDPATTAPSATKEGMSTMTIIGIVLGVLALFFALFLFARKSAKAAG